jgi:glutathione synthase/RimK-type ligase-like ATP-grasp enzyme
MIPAPAGRTVPSVRLVVSAAHAELPVDDRLLLAELRRSGLAADVAVWDDPGVDWSGAGLTVIRAVLDYHHRLDEFLAWARRVDGQTRLVNPLSLITWNSHKGYLRDLAGTGIPVIPTAWVSSSEGASPARIAEAHGWAEMIIKPAVSSSADHTVRIGADRAQEGERHLAELLRRGDVLIQPYLPELTRDGEISLIWFGGVFSHAVRRPAGLYATTADLLTGRLLEPTEEQYALAARVHDLVRPVPTYARVDLVATAAGLMVIELELIEPALYFRRWAPAASSLTAALLRLPDLEGVRRR